MIIGTLPPPRFSLGELREKDVNFCYGSCDGLLWPVLDSIYGLGLRYDNSLTAVAQRKEFLRTQKMGICDIVASCKREKVDASDLGMQDVVLRDILAELKKCPTLDTLIFAGGNTKNGPEYFFRKQLKEHGLRLDCIQDTVPRRHGFVFNGRPVTAYTLTSPSKAANRAIGSNPYFKKQKLKNPAYSPFDFRVKQYRRVFLTQT